MKKQIIALLLCGIAAVTLCACSNSNTEDKNQSKKTQSTVSVNKDTVSGLFTYEGTESEYTLTESDTEELFKKQKTEKDNKTKSEKPSNTSSKATSSDTFDKDGDGWTDGWN